MGRFRDQIQLLALVDFLNLSLTFMARARIYIKGSLLLANVR